MGSPVVLGHTMASAHLVLRPLADLRAVNPNARSQEDRRTPEELLDLIEAKGREVVEAVAALRGLREDSA